MAACRPAEVQTSTNLSHTVLNRRSCQKKSVPAQETKEYLPPHTVIERTTQQRSGQIYSPRAVTPRGDPQMDFGGQSLSKG